jgi:retron-type reverse transcriptase
MPHLLNVDIKDFFPSVTAAMVQQVFLGLGFPTRMSRILTLLCTYRGALPQGAPTSPSLANLVFLKVDSQLLHFANVHGFNYSRYADDLTFSGERRIDASFLEGVARIVRRHGFTLNAKKTMFYGPNQPKYVTGFVVNRRVQPDRETRRRLRAMFHNADERPNQHSAQSGSLRGWASFVNSYDAAMGKEYMETAKKVAAANASRRARAGAEQGSAIWESTTRNQVS